MLRNGVHSIVVKLAPFVVERAEGVCLVVTVVERSAVEDDTDEVIQRRLRSHRGARGRLRREREGGFVLFPQPADLRRSGNFEWAEVEASERIRNFGIDLSSSVEEALQLDAEDERESVHSCFTERLHGLVAVLAVITVLLGELVLFDEELETLEEVDWL